jgi:hypothetical protein
MFNFMLFLSEIVIFRNVTPVLNEVFCIEQKVVMSIHTCTWLLTVEEVKLDVSYDEYCKRLVDQCAFSISCMATVHDTNYEYYAQDDFRVRKPDIEIKVQFEFLSQNSVSGCYPRWQLIIRSFYRDFMKHYFNFLNFFLYNHLSGQIR